MNSLKDLRREARATGGKVYKYAINHEGKTYRFERKRDAVAFLDRQTCVDIPRQRAYEAANVRHPLPISGTE